MKTVYGIICAFALLVMANACTPKDSFTIEGNIAGIPDGTVMTLTPGGTHQDEKTVAEATVAGGKFSFDYAVESPRMFYIGQQGAGGVLPVVVENGTRVKLAGTVAYTGEGTQKWADFSKVQVSGSPIHEEYLAKMSFKNELDELYRETEQRHADISRQLGEARGAGNQALTDSLMQTEAYAALERDNATFFATVNNMTKTAIMNNKDSWWAPFLMLNTMGWFEDEQKEWFAAFSDEAKQSYYGKIVEAELFPPASEGKPAPAFTVKDADGNTLTLQQLMAGKKYVLIDFWASWCGPCRKEIPNLKAAYETFAPRGLEIISISTDRDPAAWQKALDEEQLPWLNFRDDSGIADAYSVQAIPAIFLLDADGTILATKLRGEALQQKLAELLP